MYIVYRILYNIMSYVCLHTKSEKQNEAKTETNRQVDIGEVCEREALIGVLIISLSGVCVRVCSVSGVCGSN